MQKIVAIAGPTASGKSKIAVELAKNLNGEIISVDSMQIYKKMDIGTAKVTASEMQNIPHYLIDIVEPNIQFSVSEFVSIAKQKIDEIIQKGKLPILVGGTGLYFESLIYPFNFGEAKSDEKVKTKLLKELEEHGAEYLHNKLMQIDPVDAEKIHPNNTKRLIRALEIYEISGKSKSDLSCDRKLLYDVDMYVLNCDRDVLNERITERVQAMFDTGLLAEVKNLLDSHITFDMQSMQGIGYKEFEGYFSGKSSLDDVKNAIILNTKHYAKRQVTWFKRYKFANFVTIQDLKTKFNLIFWYVMIRGILLTWFKLKISFEKNIPSNRL